MMIEQSIFETERNSIFSKLFTQNWENKQIWEHIANKELIATPAFEGEFYQQAKTKIMFVGRALNGWEEELGDCSTLENTVNSILNQKGALETFINKEGFGDGPRKYKHINSKFFRFIKQILEFTGESDIGLEKTFYNDSKNWNQKFVWANLYCIAPRSSEPGTDANPKNKMIKPSVGDYVDLMQLYIEHYKPDVVVFITDVYGWFVKWSRQKSFKDITNNYREFVDNDVIVAKGNIRDSRIVVCKRPDRRGLTYNKVEEMAEIVAKFIKGE